MAAAGEMDHLEEIRTRVFVDSKRVSHVSANDDAAPDGGEAFSIENFKKDLQIQMISCTPEACVFDIVGIDTAIANAFRRILISEIPTMAIETVKIFQNTSLLSDEVLAHRLGLIPILADARKFKYLNESNGIATEENTLVFTLDVACTRIKGVPESAPLDQRMTNSTVLSDAIQWEAQGRQAKTLADEVPRPIHDDIIVAKLRPGQVIQAELHAVKGLGAEHAKWSPVCTASYRLLPEITFAKPIEDDLADKLVASCPMGVYDIEDLADGRHVATVANPRSCTMCRECVREEPLDELVKLRRVRDHFIFSIESVGAYSAAELFTEAVGVLRKKCDTLLDQLP